MSWRVLIFLILVAAGLSAWGGVTLGNWLVAHGPVAPPIPEIIGGPGKEILDADGKPYVAQPPQPLVSGRLGIPELNDQIEWEIKGKSLAHNRFSSPIAIGVTSISMQEAIDIAHGNTQKEIEGIANVGDLLSKQRGQTIQPIDIPPVPDTHSNSTNDGDSNWQEQLRADLKACSNVGFFSRPSCSWNARNKYCEPNNAWGQIPECPSRSY